MSKIYKQYCTDRLFLLGLPLSGKSTLGKLLAEQLDWPFYDLDQQICRALGYTSVADIFTRQDETTFRRSEREVLSTFLQRRPPFVLSTGGGTPCYKEQMTQLQAAGTTIYLHLPWRLMEERSKSSQLLERPLLKKWMSQGAESLRLGCTKRLLYYKQADIHFSIRNRPAKEQAHQLFLTYTQSSCS